MWFLTHSGITESLNLLKCIKLKDTTSCSQNISSSHCQLHLYGFKVPLVTVKPFWTPTKPCLTSTFTSCQLQLQFFAFRSPPFCSSRTQFKCFWICVSQAIVLSLAQIKLFSIPIVDCFWIAPINTITNIIILKKVMNIVRITKM